MPATPLSFAKPHALITNSIDYTDKAKEYKRSEQKANICAKLRFIPSAILVAMQSMVADVFAHMTRFLSSADAAWLAACCHSFKQIVMSGETECTTTPGELVEAVRRLRLSIARICCLHLELTYFDSQYKVDLRAWSALREVAIFSELAPDALEDALRCLVLPPGVRLALHLASLPRHFGTLSVSALHVLIYEASELSLACVPGLVELKLRNNRVLGRKVDLSWPLPPMYTHLPDLRRLILCGFRLCDARCWDAWPALTELSLEYMSIEAVPATVRARLQTLELYVNDDVKITGLPALRDLTYNPVRSEHSEPLRDVLANLTRLTLINALFSDIDWRQAERLRSLVILCSSAPYHHCANLEADKLPRRLETLDARGLLLEDLDHLPPGLREITLDRAYYSEPELLALRRQLPATIVRTAALID